MRVGLVNFIIHVVLGRRRFRRDRFPNRVRNRRVGQWWNVRSCTAGRCGGCAGSSRAGAGAAAAAGRSNAGAGGAGARTNGIGGAGAEGVRVSGFL